MPRPYQCSRPIGAGSCATIPIWFCARRRRAGACRAYHPIVLAAVVDVWVHERPDGISSIRNPVWRDRPPRAHHIRSPERPLTVLRSVADVVLGCEVSRVARVVLVSEAIHCSGGASAQTGAFAHHFAISCLCITRLNRWHLGRKVGDRLRVRRSRVAVTIVVVTGEAVGQQPRAGIRYFVDDPTNILIGHRLREEVLVLTGVSPVTRIPLCLVARSVAGSAGLCADINVERVHLPGVGVAIDVSEHPISGVGRSVTSRCRNGHVITVGCSMTWIINRVVGR